MYLFVLRRLARKCTKIYNACRTIVRLIKPFVLRLFRYRCGLYKVPAVVVYKKSRCRHISVVYASIFAILTSKSLKNSKRAKLCGLSFSTLVKSVPFAHGNFRKFLPEFLVERKAPHLSPFRKLRNFWSNGKRPVSFDPWHLTRSPPIGKRFWVGRYITKHLIPLRNCSCLRICGAWTQVLIPVFHSPFS